MTRVVQVTPELDDFEQRVDLDGERFTLRLRFNSRAQRWFCNISDADGNPLAMGRALVLDAPLLLQLHHLDVPPGELMAWDTTERKIEAAKDELGDRVLFLYVEGSELGTV